MWLQGRFQEGEIRQDPTERGRIDHSPFTGLVTGDEAMDFLTFSVGNRKHSRVLELGCELIKGNFDGHMKGEKGGVEDKTAGSDSR